MPRSNGMVDRELEVKETRPVRCYKNKLAQTLQAILDYSRYEHSIERYDAYRYAENQKAQNAQHAGAKQLPSANH